MAQVSEGKSYPRIGFNAFCGLEELAVTREEFISALSSRVKLCVNNSFSFLLPDRSTIGYYGKVLIADTFFSDSFPNDILSELFSAAAELRKTSAPSMIAGEFQKDGNFTFDFKFLLLNPFSHLAKVRANALTDGDEVMNNVFWRINTGLKNILSAVGEDLDQNEFENRKSSIGYLEQMLEITLKSQDKNKFEIRFTDAYTDLPCYQVGAYALKGVIFPDSTAKVNPWWVYVDDPTEPEDDSYSKIVNALNRLHAKSMTLQELYEQVKREKEKRRKIFVSWGGRSQNVKEHVFRQVSEKKFDANHSFVPVEFATAKKQIEDDGKEIPTIPLIYRESIDQCYAAIVLLLGEDSVTYTEKNEETQETRARQNVVLELGMARYAFGEKGVLVLADQKVKLPSNLNGEFVKRISRDKLEQNDAVLSLEISKFLDTVQ